MTVSNKHLQVLLVLMILTHAGCIIMGVVFGKMLQLASSLNLIESTSIVSYWLVKQLRIKQHIFEWREIIFFLLESVLITLVVYYLACGCQNKCIKIVEYTGFAMHTIALILLTIFAFAFKIKKLF